MKSVVAVCLALLVTGCVSSPSKAPPPASAASNAPVTLSDTDRAAVEAGVRAALGNPAVAAFRTMLATQASGVVTVCGYVNVANTKDRPYVGTLSGGSFAMSAVGDSDEQTIAVHKACAQRRVHI